MDLGLGLGLGNNYQTVCLYWLAFSCVWLVVSWSINCPVLSCPLDS